MLKIHGDSFRAAPSPAFEAAPPTSRNPTKTYPNPGERQNVTGITVKLRLFTAFFNLEGGGAIYVNMVAGTLQPG
jgi:hypothetical protein